MFFTAYVPRGLTQIITSLDFLTNNQILIQINYNIIKR